MSESIKIGQILIAQGVLSAQQVFEILQAQRRDGVPFGVLAERMFDVTVESIENAWVEQYIHFTGVLDLRQQRVDSDVLRLINRRQAWQFEILPLKIEPTGELLMAASKARLVRAVKFVATRLSPVVYFRILESTQLRSFLRLHYPMPEVTQEMVQRVCELANEQPDQSAA